MVIWHPTREDFKICAMWDMDLPSQGSSLSSSGSVWTIQQNKIFENALADFDKDTPDRWEKVAARLPGKTATDVRKHYEDLVEDVTCIEAGRVALPTYSNSSCSLEWLEKSGAMHGLKQQFGSGGRGQSTKASEQERKKGVPWTEEEHRQFLMGLRKYGKGDWRSISRNFVVSRTPTQVASHAQKYYIRLGSDNKNKRRSSIHDITTVHGTDRMPSPLLHVSNRQTNSPSTQAEMNHSPCLTYPSQISRGPLINSLGPQIDGNLLFSPHYPLNLYTQRGFGGLSPRTIIPDSSIAMHHSGYPGQSAMQY